MQAINALSAKTSLFGMAVRRRDWLVLRPSRDILSKNPVVVAPRSEEDKQAGSALAFVVGSLALAPWRVRNMLSYMTVGALVVLAAKTFSASVEEREDARRQLNLPRSPQDRELSEHNDGIVALGSWFSLPLFGLAAATRAFAALPPVSQRSWISRRFGLGGMTAEQSKIVAKPGLGPVVSAKPSPVADDTLSV